MHYAGEILVPIRAMLTGGTMSVCEGQDLDRRSRLYVRRAPLSEDQGRNPGGYGTQMDG